MHLLIFMYLKGTSPRAEPMTPDANSRIPADGENGRGEDLLIVVIRSLAAQDACLDECAHHVGSKPLRE
jgi:hypothetical protein